MVLSPAVPSTVTRAAPALKAMSASSSPASMVLRSAKTTLSGCAALMAVTARRPSALISGVPSSMMSTYGATLAASASASSVVNTSMATWSFMSVYFLLFLDFVRQQGREKTYGRGDYSRLAWRGHDCSAVAPDAFQSVWNMASPTDSTTCSTREPEYWTEIVSA